MIAPLDFPRSQSELAITPIKESCGEPSFAAFEQWLGQIGRSRPTIEIYVRLLERFRVFELESGLSAGRAWVAYPISTQTRRLTGCALRLYAVYLKEVGEDGSSFVPTRLPKASVPRPDPLSNREVLAILAAARRVLPPESARTLRLWVLLLAATGLRRAEAAGLRWVDVTWGENPSVMVKGKGGEDRMLPLSKRMARALAEIRRLRPRSPWVGSRGGNCLAAASLGYLFRRAAVAAGLPDAHPHRIRHMALTRFAGRCAGNIHTFREAAGHRTLAASLWYVKVGEDDVRSLMCGLGR